MAWPDRYKRVTSLALTVLVFGAAGSAGIRTCPHHLDGGAHGSVHSGVDGGRDAPATDPGPCDHDLGVCETLASDPALPAPQASNFPVRTVETHFAAPESGFVAALEPRFLLPYSTGPPLPIA